MLFSVGEFLDDEISFEKVAHYKLYIVRENETVFYVGKSKRDAHSRLLEHFGIGTFGFHISSLGRLVLKNLPISRDWQIELLNPEDCGIDELDFAEEALIYELRPCLNKTSNRNPSPLPEEYQEDNSEGAIRAVSALLGMEYKKTDEEIEKEKVLKQLQREVLSKLYMIYG